MEVSAGQRFCWDVTTREIEGSCRGMPRWESSGWDSQAGLDRDTRVVKLVVRVVKRG